MSLALVESRVDNANRTHVAREVGVTREFVSLVLSGKREPSLPVAARIADVLDIELGQFYKVWESRKAA